MKTKAQVQNELSDTLIHLMRQKPLDKITVTDIAFAYGLTRQVYYHYFSDKYNLLEWMICRDIYPLEFGIPFHWKNVILAYFDRLLPHKEFYQLASLSKDSEFLYHTLIKIYAQIYTNIIEYHTGNIINDDLSFKLSLFCIGGFDKMMEWFRSGMEMTTFKLMELFADSMPAEINHLLVEIPVPMEIAYDDLANSYFK